MEKTYNRQGNFDLLRIVCTIAVIMIHVSAQYKLAITDESIFGSFYTMNIPAVVIYNTISRFAVPCFMMLSGAFLLSNHNNSNYKYFYRKSFKNIGIPTFIFTICYFLYSMLIEIIKMNGGGGITDLLNPIKDLLIGAPYYHMWYLYTLIGVYLLVPIIIKFKDDIGEKRFGNVTWIFLVISTISEWTSSFQIHWAITKVIGYVAFVMVGYELRKISLEKKSNIKGLILILFGFLVEMIVSYIQYGYSMKGVAEVDEIYSIVGNFNPLIVLASVLIFAGFSFLNVKHGKFQKLATNTFILYLFHAGVLHIVRQIIIKKVWADIDCGIVIPFCIIIVFVVSYILAYIYNKLWGIIDKNNRVSDWMCHKIHLD